ANGEGTAQVLLGLELVVPGALAKVADLVRDAGQAKTLNVLHNRGNETRGSSNSNADVCGVVLTDHSLAVLLVPAGVDSWHLQEGSGACLDKEVIDRKLVLAIRRLVESLT